MNTLLLKLIIFSISLQWVISFAEWMTKDFCDRPLLVNEIIMNQKVVPSTERSIVVTRNGKELQNGDSYVPGETLDIMMQQGEKRIQHVFESTPNAIFENGGCEGTRSAKVKAALRILPTADTPLKLIAGWATGHETVHLTPEFILKPQPLTAEAVALIEARKKEILANKDSHDNMRKDPINLIKIKASESKKHNTHTKKIDTNRLHAALRGEDIIPNLLDPALKHTKSNAFYVIIYCILFTGILYVLFRMFFNHSDTKHALRYYLRKVRGKLNEKN